MHAYEILTGVFGHLTVSGGRKAPHVRPATTDAVNSVAVSGGKIWASYYQDTTHAWVGVWDANTGAPINPTLVSGLTAPNGIAVYGGKLYVALTFGSLENVNGIGTVAEYDATTGAPINTQFISGLNDPCAIVIVPPPFVAQIQQPINADGSSVFSVRRGVVPVKFTFTLNGVATCDLLCRRDDRNYRRICLRWLRRRRLKLQS